MNSETVGEVARGLIAVAVVGGLIFLVATGQEIPSGFQSIASVVIGFYFGVATAVTGARLLRSR